MSITRLMTSPVEYCTPGTDMAAAAMIMWRSDCGMVPVVEPDSSRLVGVITDRDICMAAATRHQPACCIPVGDVMARTIVTCRSSDPVGRALARMTEHRVRRVPVVDDQSRLVGVLSIADLICAAGVHGREHGEPVVAATVLSALRSICRPREAGEEPTATRAGTRSGRNAPAGRRSARV